MHIVMFSMTPLFARKSMGGAQKQLKKVALHLAEQGHEVTLLCTWRKDTPAPFHWHERARVIPLYRFKQPFPEPYETPVYNIANAINDTADYLARADVFYNHDGGLIFPYVYQDTPAVISLRSILFSETLQSGFLFNGDALILPSQHTAQSWLQTSGQFFPQLEGRLRVIHNGLDFEQYRPTSPDALRALIPDFDPQRWQYLLYPHRPETPKGIEQAILVAEKLIKDYGMTRLRVLVPRWIDTGLAEHVRAYYQGLERQIAERGLKDVFIFHDWVSDELMPTYLSAGSASLVLGNYVETFGNIPYESLACGTLPVVARVGAYRGMLDAHVPMVDYGDLEGAAEQLADILRHERRTPPETLAWLHQHFQQSEMVRAYEETILQASKQASLAYVPRPVAEVQAWRLPVWCYVTQTGRIWHDFLGAYYDEPELVHLTRQQAVFSPAAVSADVLNRWRRDGFIVPAPSQEA